MSYTPRYGSKRWKADHQVAGRPAAYKCNNCGRLLLHPTSILRHFGGACLKKLIKQHEQTNANKSPF